MKYLILFVLIILSYGIRFRFKVKPGEMQCFSDELASSMLLVGEAKASSIGY